MNELNKQARKKHKRKVAETENTPDAVMDLSNNTANDTLSYECFEKCIFSDLHDRKISKLNKKHKKHKNSETEYSPKKNDKSKVTNTNDVTDCEIGELTIIENSDYLSSTKNRKKKRKHKVDNDETISDNNILDLKESENDAGMELKEKKKHHKMKHKPESFDELENVSKSKIGESDETENHIILKELYKRKKHHKHKLNEEHKLSLCVNTNIDGLDLYQNNLNDEIIHGAHKKKHKLTTAESLLETINMEPNYILNITRSHNGIAKSKTEDQNIFKLNKKNVANSETKTKKRHKKKYGYVDGTQEFDCNIDSAVTKNVYDVKISKKCERKEGKHKLTDEYVENDIQNLEKDTSIEFSKYLRGKKKKKNKHKLYERENVSNHQKSTDDKSEEKRVIDTFDAHQKKDKRKHAKGHKHSIYKTIDTNTKKIDQDSLGSETLNGFHKNKKKHKLLHDNIFDCNIQESTVDISKKSRILDVLYVQKRKDNLKQIEVEGLSDYETTDLNAVGMNENYLNSVRKKKKKHDPFNETEYVSGYKTANLNNTEMNQNDLNSDTPNRFHKKKNKHKLFNEMETISNSNIKRSDVDEQEMIIILDGLDTQKRNDKCKETGVHKLSYTKNTDSKNLSIGTIDKSKKKKHRHEAIEAEDMPNTVVLANDMVNDGHSIEDKEKSIVESSVEDRSFETKSAMKKRKYKKHIDSGVERVPDNLKEEGKDINNKALVIENDQAYENYNSFDSFTCNMDEVPVPFPIPLLHESETVGTIPPEKRAYLEENGVKIYTGKWTKNEDDILKRNFLQFGLEFGVNNPYQLLGINQSHKQVQITKFLAAKHFWLRLGKDLDNRSLRSIYMRARKLLNPLNNKGKLTAEEAAHLKEAHDLVGNKWTRISDMLSRSEDKCHTAFRWHKSDINKGKWSPKEEKRLIEAIKVVTGIEDISANNLSNISWKEIAKYVSTRNEFQCYKQWAEHHAWDPSVTEKKRWKKHLYGKLIYLIKDKYCYNSEHEIDWRELHKHFIDVTPSYAFLRKKWFYLKERLPKGVTFSHSKCLDALARIYEKSYKIFAEVINQ